MNTVKKVQGFNNCFHYKGVDPGPSLEKEANLKLVQLLAMAPPGATAIWSVEKTGKNYLAEIRIYSSFRSFSTRSEGLSADAVVHRALERMEDQLYRWRWGRDEVLEHRPTSSDFRGLPYAKSG